MILTFKPIQIWPEGWDRTSPPRVRAPFKTSYRDTIATLTRELGMLWASDPYLQVDALGSQVRNDGQLRADARVDYPGVILSFETKRFGTLTYPCNRFGLTAYGVTGPVWHANLRAIALGLEALRKVERYGIAERGQQYAGYAALGTGIALGQHQMTVEEAWTILREGANTRMHLSVDAAYRKAVKLHHPDNGGDPALFDKITEARNLIKAKGEL